MGTRSCKVWLAALCLLTWGASQLAHATAADAPTSLTIGIAQVALEPTLAENRDKIVRFLREAKDRGCRVVVFPETALYWPPGTAQREIDAAVADLQKEADACDVYAIVCGHYQRDGKEKPYERLLVVDPGGRIIQTYNKLWHDARFQTCPGLFEIDGIPCSATLCADRWIRSVEELPAMAGAKILFECSNNYDNEWLADLGWYWYVPRALRNEVFVVFANTGREDRGQLTPGHGHSAVIAPSGKLLAALEEESDKLLVCELDLTQATGGQALTRRSHPLMKPFWDTGLALLDGEQVAAGPHRPLTSSEIELKIAAAQMACSRALDENAAHIVELMYAAKDARADVVVFSELALTGARDEDIRAARQQDLEAGLALIQKAARQLAIYVVVGLPWHEGSRRTNCAVVVGPDGKLLTRYEQLVVDRPELFAAGTSTRAMWFEVKGVPCVATIGRDALWSELAELAALRGAQVHLHLAYDRDTSPEAKRVRKQLWANLASFRTFTATVNAASPRTLPQPSAPAAGGSAIWEDFHRAAGGKAGHYFPHSAVRLAEAKEDEFLLTATQTIPKTNPQFRVLTEKTNSQMTPWYVTGAGVSYSAQAEAKK